LCVFRKLWSNSERLSVRILIVDDHRLFAEALQVILATDPRLSVVGLAPSGEQAVQMAEELAPDLVLMDISMPGMGGFEATKRIVSVRPEVRVLMVTGSDAQQDLDAALAAGAVGYVTKDRIAAELVGTILATAA
jgi:DNA-binding NarL/FixJ family response regulator